ncbi:MAG: signal recognition particle receptor subunit alpha [Candidatus Njordarchaeia archaeon]
MLDNFRGSLQKLLAKIRGAAYIDEKMLDEIIRDFVRTLIDADVNVDLAFQIGERVKEKVLSTKVPEGIPLNNFVLRILYEELVELMGKKSYKLNIIPGKQNKIVFVGLQGSGKTTTIAKLAYYLKKRGYRVGVIGADTYRPGAYDQLKQLTEKIDVPFYGEPGEKDAIKIIKHGLQQLKKADVVLIDTAGRHKEEKGLIEEMKKIIKAVKPQEVILVIDGIIGQRAFDQAKAFAEATKIGSIIVTKLDGSAKGGGALAAAAATGAPIKFIGTGEKIEDFEEYVPQRFVSRLIGISIEDLEELIKVVPKGLIKGKFTLRDIMEYYESMLGKGGLTKRIKDMFSIGDISDKQIQVGLKRQLAILKSMTPEELDNPILLKDKNRLIRIARGSGTSTTDIRRLLNQYEMMRKYIRSLMRSRNLSKEAALSKLLKGEIDLSELKNVKGFKKMKRAR